MAATKHIEIAGKKIAADKLAERTEQARKYGCVGFVQVDKFSSSDSLKAVQR